MQEAGGGFIKSSAVVQQVYEKAKAAGHDFDVGYVPVTDTEEAFKVLQVVCPHFHISRHVQAILK